MNLLHSFEKSLHSDLRKQIRCFWCVANTLHRNNVFVVKSRKFSDTRVSSHILTKIVFRPIVDRVFSKKYVNTAITRSQLKSVFDVDTNVKKDVLLYENKSEIFSVLNYLVPVQLVAWTTLSYGYIRNVSVLPPEYLNVFNLVDLNKLSWRYGVLAAFMFAGNYLEVTCL